MRYIICKKLHRKNARRKEDWRATFASEEIAIENFKCRVMYNADVDKYDYELLTGDWNHIAFYTKEYGLVVGPYITMKSRRPKESDEIVKLFYGMSESMQKAVKDIMIVTQKKGE